MSASPTAKHDYSQPGTYTVALTVTDNAGQQTTTTQQVTVTAPPPANLPPVASFTAELVSPSSNVLDFNASASHDPDGQISRFDIDWGDGSAHGVQAITTHTYTANGTYQVTLTCTDNLGATAQATQTVTVTGSGPLPPPPPPPPPPTSTKGLPAFDHIIYVWMENHSATQIYGNSTAPYINGLANTNAKFTNAKAESHPSQPNYLAGFAGSTMSVTDDNDHDLTGNNLFTQLKSASLTFHAFSEDLPSAGYLGSTSGGYARKHAPWVSFQASGSFDGANHLPFTSFPTDYSQLPKVSWVVPNLVDDMHDGTVAQGDAWLQTHIDPLIKWAKTHNSLVIITWDEDDYSGANGNDVALIMAGDKTNAGTYTQTVNHYDLLGLIQDVCGVARLNNSTGLPVFSYPFVAAKFTSSVNVQAATFDASSSVDPNGISSYAWTFGDGGTGTGVKVNHTYAASGNFSVTLTTTDSKGYTSSVTQTITITIPVTPGPTPPPPTTPPPTQSGLNGTGTASTGTPTASISCTFAKAVVSVKGTATATNPTPEEYYLQDAAHYKQTNLHPTQGNVMQAIQYVPQSTYTYMAQAHNGSNGTTAPWQSFSIARFGSDGVERDRITLVDSFHGWSFGVEYDSSGYTWIWTVWGNPGSSGKKWDIVRFKWHVGGGTYTRSNPPPGMQVVYPGNIDGDQSQNIPSFSVGDSDAMMFFSDGTFRKWPLSVFLAGQATKANNSAHIKPGTGSSPAIVGTGQGFCSRGNSMFWYTGHQSSNGIDQSDPPTIWEYSWTTGGRQIGKYRTDAIGQVNGKFPSNTYEPEGISVYHNGKGGTYLYVGVCTNPSGNYNYELYLMTMPLTNKIDKYEWDWGDGSAKGSGTSASHTYSSNGNYTITLTVTDYRGDTGTYKQPITIVK